MGLLLIAVCSLFVYSVAIVHHVKKLDLMKRAAATVQPSKRAKLFINFVSFSLKCAQITLNMLEMHLFFVAAPSNPVFLSNR